MKPRESGFSRRALEAHTTLFGMWIAGYWPVSDFWFVLNAWVGVLTEFLGRFYVDHMRFDPRHPYIERLYTDALINTTLMVCYSTVTVYIQSCKQAKRTIRIELMQQYYS